MTELDFAILPRGRLVPRCTCGPLSLQPCRVCLDPPLPSSLPAIPPPDPDTEPMETS